MNICNAKVFLLNRIDGGVSKNDFVCQLLADMTNMTVERQTTSELSVLGCAYLTGLSSGKYLTPVSNRR